MHLLENLKQKSVARKSMILLAAITLSAAVATNALAAGHGGGGGLGGGGGFGGGHIGSGGGFAAGHIGGGSVGGRIAGERPGGHGDAYLGNRGVSTFMAPTWAVASTIEITTEITIEITTSAIASSSSPAMTTTMTTMITAWAITPATARAFSIGMFTPPPAGSGVRSGYATEPEAERI